jgi:hypothetical protein
VLRRLRIRAKLILVSALPLVCLLGVVLAASSTRARAVATSAELADEVRLSGVVDDVLHELQRERGLSSGLVGGGFQGDDRGHLDEQRAVVDRARQRLADAAARSATTPTGQALVLPLRRLEDLSGHRSAIDRRGFGVTATLGWYDDTIEEFLRSSASLSRAVSDTELLSQLSAYAALSRAKEAAALEQGLINGVIGQGSFQPDQYRQLLTLVGAQRAERDVFDAVASPAQRNELAAAYAAPEIARAAEMERQAMARPTERLDLRADEWWDLTAVKIDRYRAVEQSLAGDVARTAAARAADARTGLALVLGGGLALVAGTAAIVAGIARSISRPVSSLTARAYRAARTDLPRIIGSLQATDGPPVLEELPAVEVDTDDELAELASAFNSVQEAAVELAADQAVLRQNVAEMFVNLGRRNQALIGRQLAFIDRLERDEADPDQLEKLFRLDHMSTRMRRNAESLLVLAGADLPRRWSSAVPVADIVRAGLSEIEDYTRVDLGDLADVGIAGVAATDLTHLLAELLENATMFSAPSSRVKVHGARRDDGYLMAVVDHGVGMAPSQLSEANTRIDELARFDRSPSKMLGLYVVGRLAARHGIAVRLVESATVGLTAKVLIPATVLDHVPDGDQRSGAALVDGGERPVPALVGAPAGDAGRSDGRAPLARRPRRSRGTASRSPLPARAPGTRALQVVLPGDTGDIGAEAHGPDTAVSGTPAAAGASSRATISAGGENSLRALRHRVRGAQLPDGGPPAAGPAASARYPDAEGRAGEVRTAIGAFQQAVARGRLAVSAPAEADNHP